MSTNLFKLSNLDPRHQNHSFSGKLKSDVNSSQTYDTNCKPIQVTTVYEPLNTYPEERKWVLFDPKGA